VWLQLDGQPQVGSIPINDMDLYYWDFLPGFGSVQISATVLTGNPVVFIALGPNQANTADSSNFQYSLQANNSAMFLEISASDAQFVQQCPNGATAVCYINLGVYAYSQVSCRGDRHARVRVCMMSKMRADVLAVCVCVNGCDLLLLLQPASYLITIRHQGVVTTLQAGMPVTGYVAHNAYDYYSINVFDSNMVLNFALTALSGDPDMFIGTSSDQLPTQVVHKVGARCCAATRVRRLTRERCCCVYCARVCVAVGVVCAGRRLRLHRHVKRPQCMPSAVHVLHRRERLRRERLRRLVVVHHCGDSFGDEPHSAPAGRCAAVWPRATAQVRVLPAGHGEHGDAGGRGDLRLVLLGQH
jgi:hypothetical protein